MNLFKDPEPQDFEVIKFWATGQLAISVDGDMLWLEEIRATRPEWTEFVERVEQFAKTIK